MHTKNPERRLFIIASSTFFSPEVFEMSFLKVKMIPNHENNVRNEFSMLNSVELDVLHLHILQKIKTLDFTSSPRAAIFDLAIAPFVAGWETSTSVIFHAQGPINKVQARNSPNTILQTGLQARSRIITEVGNQQKRSQSAQKKTRELVPITSKTRNLSNP